MLGLAHPPPKGIYFWSYTGRSIAAKIKVLLNILNLLYLINSCLKTELICKVGIDVA